MRIYFASRGTWGGAWNCSLPRWTLSIRDAPYPSAQLPPWALLIAPIPSQVSKSSRPLTSTLNPYFGKGCSSWNFYVLCTCKQSRSQDFFKNINPNGTYLLATGCPDKIDIGLTDSYWLWYIPNLLLHPVPELTLDWLGQKPSRKTTWQLRYAHLASSSVSPK